MSFIPDSMNTIIVEETLLTLYIASIYRYLIIYIGRIAEQQVLNLSPDKKESDISNHKGRLCYETRKAFRNTL